MVSNLYCALLIQSRGHSLSQATASNTITSSSDAADDVLPDEAMPEVMKAENMLKDMEELTGKMGNLKPLNSTEEAKIKEVDLYTIPFIVIIYKFLEPLLYSVVHPFISELVGSESVKFFRLVHDVQHDSTRFNDSG